MMQCPDCGRILPDEKFVTDPFSNKVVCQDCSGKERDKEDKD